MAKQKPHLTGSQPFAHNVIAFPVGAAAYAERAMRALERMQNDKALQYFRRAAEIEPESPIHQCNLAGALAETGHYESSNQILKHVVTDMEPEMTECYYYMANNWAYLGDFDAALSMLEQYLTIDPQGVYSEEAEAMLEMVRYELGSSNHRSLARGIGNQLRNGKVAESREQSGEAEEMEQADLKQGSEQAEIEAAQQHSDMEDETSHLSEQEQNHRRARQMLEEGRFAEALQLLQSIVEQDPDYLAAGNNLALAYYYMGQFDDAIAALNDVLTRDGGNLHALCNLAVFERNAGHEDVVSQLIAVLVKMEPLHREHGYKLATTMGILGEHGEAYRHLKRIVSGGKVNDPNVYHYAAVAACHIQRYEEAARWWAISRRLDPHAGIATYYLEQLQQLQPGAELEPQPSYHYRLPYDEASRKHKHAKPNTVEATEHQEQEDGQGDKGNWQSRLKRDPLVRSSLLWALRLGEMPTKLQALEAMKMIGDDEAIETLRNLLIDPTQQPYMRQVTYYTLRRLSVEDPLEIMTEHGIEFRETTHVIDQLPSWEPSWLEVMTKLRSHMDEEYELFIVHDAEVLWIEYLTISYPETSKRLNADGWAAALQYLICKLYRRPVSYQQLSTEYGVSAATISKNVKRMEAVCHTLDEEDMINSSTSHSPG